MNGLEVNPNTNRVKRRTDGRKYARISSYYKTCQKSRCSVSIWIWRIAYFMSDINVIFPNLNQIRISKRCGRRHGPGSNSSFKDGNLCISPRCRRLNALLLFHVRREQLLGVVNNVHNLCYCPSLFQRYRSQIIPL